jgi:CubicO group peptidase (beta-lactamase class C family)
MNHVIALILAKERRMVSRFAAAGATSREQARSLEQLGVSRGVILRRLRERAVVRQVGTDLYYVDQESWNAVRRMRRRTASVMVAIVLAIVFSIVFGARRARAQEPSRIDWTAVDSVFGQWNRKSSPGCAVGVFRNGQIMYERGYGMADLENDIPITPASVFYVGSVSKQFTAMAAALTMQDHKQTFGNGERLSADDPVRKWLPELPSYADAITVRDLVHHTSGLRDYNTLLAIAGRRGDDAYDNRTVLLMTARQKALNFAPRTEYLYSNTGYTLLATVVERATKTPFAAYADTNIFKPLGMTDTHFHTDAGRLVKRRAYAYAVRADGSVRLDTPSNERAGAGGVYTSVRELLHWDENFYTGKVGGKALIEQLQTPGRLKNGTELRYAWGLHVGRYRELRIVEHGGSLGGYRAHLIRFPGQHTSFAALCNLAINPGALLKQVADDVLHEHLKGTPPVITPAPAERPAAASAPSATVDAQGLGAYAGQYLSDEINSVFNIAVVNGQLTLQRDTDSEPIPLRPLQPDSFRALSFTIRFVKEEGRVTSLIVDAGRVRGIAFERGNRRF